MKKWKKRRTWTLAMTLVLLAVLSLSACGSKLSNPAATAETTAAGYAMDVREAAITMAPAGEDLNGLKAESGSGLSPSPDIGSPGEAGRKLIRDVSMNVEARDFDGVLSQITDKVGELGGYVESSDVSGIPMAAASSAMRTSGPGFRPTGWTALWRQWRAREM